jgi:hypothetical protein
MSEQPETIAQLVSAHTAKIGDRLYVSQDIMDSLQRGAVEVDGVGPLGLEVLVNKHMPPDTFFIYNKHSGELVACRVPAEDGGRETWEAGDE